MKFLENSILQITLRNLEKISYIVVLHSNLLLSNEGAVIQNKLSKELGTFRAVVKVRKSCVQMTLPMIRIGPKLHQMTSELWDSINAIQNPYPLVR